MIPVMETQTRMEHVTLLKSVFKKVAQMKEVAHRAMVYAAHVSLDENRFVIISLNCFFLKEA
jgi:hypothetical protein